MDCITTVILLPNMTLAISSYLSKTKLWNIKSQSHNFQSCCVRRLGISSQFHSSKLCHFQVYYFSSLLVFILAHTLLTDRLWSIRTHDQSSRNTEPEPQDHLERAHFFPICSQPTPAHTFLPVDCAEGLEQSWQGHTVWFCCQFKLGLSFYV